MSRADKITSIIEKRRPLARKIEGVEASLKSLNSSLGQLEQQRQLLMGQGDDPDTTGKLNQIDLSNIRLDIAAELEAIAKLKARFTRQNLNLGVVGMARQGKSRLLRSLTGLSAAEIPDGDKGHCTGVRSTIYQSPNGETYGMVWFHSEQSFLDEIIAPYYEKLRLGKQPLNIDQFAKELPPLPGDLAKESKYEAMYKYLGKYHQNLKKYRPLMGVTSPPKISKEQIREYVAQDNVTGDRVYFNYLAVQKVSIFCSFPNTDTGKIALVDMPGLGDTGIGAEERLIETLGQEVDIVLFIRLPKSTGDDWLNYDLELYDTAQKALKDRLSIEKWSFMILNRTDASSGKGDNSQQCQFLKSELERMPIKVVESIIANCADPQEANTKILDRILDYLADNIEDLDREFVSSCKQGLLELQGKIGVELQKAGNALSRGQATASGSNKEFRDLFRKIWRNLIRELQKLLKELRRESDERIETAFQSQVELAIASCNKDIVIPSSEEIEELRNTEAGSYENAYNICLNQLRTQLSKKFAQIDVGLKELIEQTKSRVTEILVDAGSLGGLTDKRGSEFIDLIAEKVGDEQSKLKQGFEILSNFNLSYSGMFQHRIRRQLEDVTPDKTEVKLEQPYSAEQIQQKLQLLHRKVIYDCDNALKGFFGEPSLAAFGMVEEFIDQVLRSENVEDDWQDFLEENKEKVWPEKFDLDNDLAQTRHQWLDLVEKVKGANQQLLESSQFMN